MVRTTDFRSVDEGSIPFGTTKLRLMGVEHYLVKPKEKTVFELGKGAWSLLDFFKVRSEVLLDEFQEQIDVWNISDLELLIEGIKTEVFYGDLGQEYLNEVADKIMKFANGNEVYYMSDCYDTYFELYKRQGYTEVGSRYVNWEP